MRHLVLFGPPGSGKGTQAALLVQRLRAHHLSTGRVLREAIAAGTPLGREAQRFIDGGKFVPDEIANAIVREYLGAIPSDTPAVLFDGYPRSVTQAHALDEILASLKQDSLDLVLLLEIPDDEVTRRLAGRRECPRCGGVFNVVSSVPSNGSECATCGGSELRLRADDNPEAIRTRIAIYHRETSPLVEHYDARGLLVRIQGNASPDVVHAEIIRALQAKLGMEIGA